MVLATALTLHADEPAKTSSGLQWTADLAAAREAAREQQRPLLLFVTMDGCTHCQRMKQTTLRDKDLQRELQAEFIPVMFNVKDQPELVKSLRLRLFPTLVVIQPNGKVRESISGYQTARQLREKLTDTKTTKTASRPGQNLER